MLFFTIFIFQVLACKHEVTLFECKSNTRLATVRAIDCDEELKIIENLPCDLSCGENKYLAFDGKQGLACYACPPHSFNLGGGEEFTYWSSTQSFESNCWVLSSTAWVLNTNCTSWHSTSETLLVSGSALADQWYESDLVFYSTLVKAGFLELVYRKESTNDASSPSSFIIFINNEVKFSDFTSNNPDWQVSRIDLEKGTQKIQFTFNKFENFYNNATSQVFIKTVRVSGTRYADTDCRLCEGVEVGAHARCVECEIGSYLDKGICKECPLGTTSGPAAGGLEDCLELRECEVGDYHYYYSDCFQGKQEKIFEWNLPVMCDVRTGKLPDKEVIDCVDCSPGTSRQDGKCTPCEPGTWANGAGECSACPPGTYASKGLVVDFWIPFPEGFKGKCVTAERNLCKYDWESRGAFITTSAFYIKRSKIFLSKQVKVSEPSGSVTFAYSIKGWATNLALFVNKVRVMSELSDQNSSFSVDLEPGDSHLDWVCSHSTLLNESCSIFHISFTGLDSGGAAGCKACHSTQVSQAKASQCSDCPVGSKADTEQTSCRPCEAGSYSPLPGVCKACPTPLVPSQDLASCVPAGPLLLGNLTFSTQNFSGNEASLPLYCLDQGLQCFESFYGPVLSADYTFYVSVLNSKTVLMPEFYQFSHTKAYIFALINTNDSVLTRPKQKFKSDPCLKNSEKVLVNLGSEVSNISLFSNESAIGFDVEYKYGDVCSDIARFKSFVRFLCDKKEKPGWPYLREAKRCEFYFEWPSLYACPVCKASELQEHRTGCKDGKRKVYLAEGERCRVEGNGESFVEECEKRDKLDKVKLAVAVGVVVALVVTVMVLCFYLKRAKDLYEDLIKNKSATVGEPETGRERQ